MLKKSLILGMLSLLVSHSALPQLYHFGYYVGNRASFSLSVRNPIYRLASPSPFSVPEVVIGDKDSVASIDGDYLAPTRILRNPSSGERTFEYRLRRLPYGLDFSGTKADSISIQGDSIWLALNRVDLKFLDLFSQRDSAAVRQLIFEDTRIGNLTMNNLHLLYREELMNFTLTRNVFIDSLVMGWCTISNEFYFDDYPLPKFISLRRDRFANPQSLFDLTRFHIDSTTGICRLALHDMKEGINFLKLNYENFELYFDSLTAPSERETIYKALLDEQLKDGFTAGHEKLDKEYRRFKYTKDETRFGKFQNWLDGWWWDYGYKKYRVITNSFEIFGVFLLLNILIYRWLIQVYFPEKFMELDNRLMDRVAGLQRGRSLLFHLLRIPGIVVYTAFVFWGLKLDIKEMELRRPIFYLILVIEYTAGLVCLAYIANYIITK